jgi:predicted amidohydrolase
MTERTTERGSDRLVVAACQVDGVAARADRSVLARTVAAAADRGARLVVLPELSACGGVLVSREQARTVAEPLDGATVSLAADLSAEHDCVVVLGLAEAGARGQVHNTAVVLDRGMLAAAYRKAHLWGAEKDAFQPGDQPPVVVDTSAGRVGVMICYDLEFPEWVRMAAEAGAEVLAVPANWPVRPGGDPQRPFEVVKARAAAVTYRVNVVVADRCGVEDGVDWYGGSLVCDVDGELLAGPACAGAGPGARPTILTGEVDLAAARDKRLGRFNDALTDRRPDLYTR